MLDWLLSLILPKTSEITRIENMSPADFANEARKPFDPPRGIYYLFRYRDRLVQKALWALKYRGSRSIAKLFARLISDELVELLADEMLFENFVEPLIIPIPLSGERLRERGWNQAEMICREIVKLQPSFTLVADVLQKIRHTPPQTKLGRAQRLKNLKGCFAVQNPEKIRGRNIILIDDVTTTGSTIAEARRALSKSGARRVLAFTIAH